MVMLQSRRHLRPGCPLTLLQKCWIKGVPGGAWVGVTRRREKRQSNTETQKEWEEGREGGREREKGEDRERHRDRDGE